MQPWFVCILSAYKIMPSSAKAPAQVNFSKLALILKYPTSARPPSPKLVPEKLSRKLNLGIQTSYNPNTNSKHASNRVYKLRKAESPF
jgi:hypothetical protein